MATEKFITVASLEPVELGDEFATLPPHITLCPPFTADPAELKQYHDRLEAVVNENTRGIEVHDAWPVMFGPHEDQPAMRVNLGLLGGLFHAGAYVGGQEIGDPDPTYAGTRWCPHVSLPNPEYRLPNVPFSISEIQLFMKTRERLWRCVARYADKACRYMSLRISA